MLYLDSALVATAKQLPTLGWVKGITTNPTLLTQSESPVAETLTQLSDLSPGELYYCFFNKIMTSIFYTEDFHIRDFSCQ